MSAQTEKRDKRISPGERLVKEHGLKIFEAIDRYCKGWIEKTIRYEDVVAELERETRDERKPYLRAILEESDAAYEKYRREFPEGDDKAKWHADHTVVLKCRWSQENCEAVLAELRAKVLTDQFDCYARRSTENGKGLVKIPAKDLELFRCERRVEQRDIWLVDRAEQVLYDLHFIDSSPRTVRRKKTNFKEVMKKFCDESPMADLEFFLLETTINSQRAKLLSDFEKKYFPNSEPHIDVSGSRLRAQIENVRKAFDDRKKSQN